MGDFNMFCDDYPLTHDPLVVSRTLLQDAKANVSRIRKQLRTESYIPRRRRLELELKEALKLEREASKYA